MANEGVDEYNAMNDQWLEIITSPKSLGPEKDIPRKVQMFYMASYNLDKFRKFIFESRFFDLFQVDEELKQKLSSDDVALMKFAIDCFSQNVLPCSSYTFPPKKNFLSRLLGFSSRPFHSQIIYVLHDVLKGM